MKESASITLSSPITMLSGVGKTRAAQLERLGIRTVRDLIYHYPRAYENRGDIALLGDYRTDAPHSYLLTVANEVSNAQIKRGLTISKFRAFDESGTVEIVFFNSPYVKDVFHTGLTFRFYGKTAFNKARRLVLQNPKYELYTEDKPLENYVPIYPLTVGVTSKILDKLIKTALDHVITSIEDPLPEELRLSLSLATLQSSLKSIHFPETEDSLARAHRRLAFDEMLTFGLCISMAAKDRKLNFGADFSPCSLKKFTDLLPYELTNDQKGVINDIYRDTVLTKVDGKTPSMARIVVGDVGSGKTVCALAAIYIAASSGYQSAMMVPTEILAHQHFEDIKNLLGELGIRCALLTGSTSASEKKKVYTALKSGEIRVVVGTHALLSDKVEFDNLGLIITDEQHRFGVAQRAVLKDRTKSAHMLVMSATPIPRTLALAVYGDLDVSRITEMPKGRMKVDTFLVNEEYRARLNGFIDKQISLGGQCYVVCPSIERAEEDEPLGLSPAGFSDGTLVRNEDLNLKNAVEYTEQLRKELPHIKIECLHGKMKNSEKDEIMHRFASGETKILVSTTVIEVGVNVPNASLIVVENAERFGLSQLHQLRGRVGRGTRKSYCVLVSDANTEKARARLEVIRTTYDGYEIAERDLMLRGPGDFFSISPESEVRQSGGLKFKIASECDDTSLFESAFECAKLITSEDPTLSLPKHQGLKSELSYSISSSNLS